MCGKIEKERGIKTSWLCASFYCSLDMTEQKQHTLRQKDRQKTEPSYEKQWFFSTLATSYTCSGSNENHSKYIQAHILKLNLLKVPKQMLRYWQSAWALSERKPQEVSKQDRGHVPANPNNNGRQVTGKWEDSRGHIIAKKTWLKMWWFTFMIDTLPIEIPAVNK